MGRALDTIVQDMAVAAAGVSDLTAELLTYTPPPNTPALRRILAGQNLQAELDRGGAMLIEPATFEGNYRITKPGTALLGSGSGSVLSGNRAPALTVELGVTDVLLMDFEAISTGAVVAQFGYNDPRQAKAVDAPLRILARRLSIPTHRGKRGIECNAGSVVFDSCWVDDVWNTTGQDTQALCILNSPGDIEVLGGSYTAGSECILIGGAVMVMTDVEEVTGVTVRGVLITRPLAWKTDGVKRKVKNLFEVKRGRRVLVEDTGLAGSWFSTDGAQDGSAIVLTPHSGGFLQDVVIRRVAVRDCSSFIQMLGQEYVGIPTRYPTSGVKVLDSTFKGSKALYGGRGIGFLITGEPNDLEVTNTTMDFDGTAVVIYDPGKVLTGVDNITTRPGGAMTSLAISGSKFPYGKYGTFLAGSANGTNPANGVKTLSIANNLIAEASATFKNLYPTNEYVDRATFDARLKG